MKIEIDLNELFPHVSETTKETLEIQRKCSLRRGDGEKIDPLIISVALPQEDRWETLKRRIRISILAQSTENRRSLIEESFKWVKASPENPDYLQLGLFSAAFYIDRRDYKIAFRRYVPLTHSPSSDYEYWALTARDSKIPYWEVNTESFSTWTDAGICLLVKSKLQRMYQAEMENVL